MALCSQIRKSHSTEQRISFALRRGAGVDNSPPPPSTPRSGSARILHIQNGPRTYTHTHPREVKLTVSIQKILMLRLCVNKTQFIILFSLHTHTHGVLLSTLHCRVIYTRRHLCRETCVPILLGYSFKEETKSEDESFFVVFFLRKLFKI